MSRPAATWRLTTEERALVAANVGLAWFAARKRWRPQYALSEDEVLSAAFMGLCHAAHAPHRDRAKPFTTYAVQAINNRISHEMRRRIEHDQRLPLQGLGIDVMAPESSREAEIEAAATEVNEWMLTLSEEDRKLVRDRLDGKPCSAIAADLGVSRALVSFRHRRLVASAGGKR